MLIFKKLGQRYDTSRWIILATFLWFQRFGWRDLVLSVSRTQRRKCCSISTVKAQFCTTDFLRNFALLDFMKTPFQAFFFNASETNRTLTGHTKPSSTVVYSALKRNLRPQSAGMAFSGALLVLRTGLFPSRFVDEKR